MQTAHRMELDAGHAMKSNAAVFVLAMLRLLRPHIGKRLFSHVPFENELTLVDDDLFNLEDFQHYRESPQVKAMRERAMGHDTGEATDHTQRLSMTQPESKLPLSQLCLLPETVIFTSELQNPFINLAIEDYVYNRMPAPNGTASDRLLFYTNSPCVVIGKNQNPWKEVNLPTLTSLRLPLIRRRSGGGTVVHDPGNVNFSYMTTKDKFDRFRFSELICRAINPHLGPEKTVTVNVRGDIVTERGSYKVSGSAYKLARGKSYHHGTMLLNLKLHVLRLLLRRDEKSLGRVHSKAAVASVASPVTNVHLGSEDFIRLVAGEFERVAARAEKKLGKLPWFHIDPQYELPEEVLQTARELQEWDWNYGATPKFTHQFTHGERGFLVTFEVGKGGLVQSMALEGANDETRDAFQYLNAVLARGDAIKYTGSNLAGFVLDDAMSEWLGNSIDGTT